MRTTSPDITMSNIPYILEERPDTGRNNSKLGVLSFLHLRYVFGGLFSAYVFLRIASWVILDIKAQNLVPIAL